jgi:hypothetical protein
MWEVQNTVVSVRNIENAVSLRCKSHFIGFAEDVVLKRHIDMEGMLSN